MPPEPTRSPAVGGVKETHSRADFDRKQDGKAFAKLEMVVVVDQSLQ